MEKTEFTLLNKIETPEDLRKLKVEDLPQVCAELRRDIIEEVAVNPGHLASSLGVAEITVALHYVYNTPEDRIVWDVGHQAYGHKILTGRKERFCTNRKLGGRFHRRKRANTTPLPADMPATRSRRLWAWRWQLSWKARKTDTWWR